MQADYCNLGSVWTLATAVIQMAEGTQEQLKVSEQEE